MASVIDTAPSPLATSQPVRCTAKPLADALAVGDLSKEVHPRSEHDRLGLAFQRLTASLRQVLRQLQTLSAQLHAASTPLEAVVARQRECLRGLGARLGPNRRIPRFRPPRILRTWYGAEGGRPAGSAAVRDGI